MLRLALVSVLFAATPAIASSYVASLQSPASAAKLVSSDRMWNCAGTTCAAGGEATSPAKRICSRLAREVGPLAGFAAQGKDFAAGDLAACNASASNAPVPSTAH